MLVYDCGEVLNGTWKEEVVGELQRKRVTSDEKFYGREKPRHPLLAQRQWNLLRLLVNIRHRAYSGAGSFFS
jgi:hypothetical protein